MARIVICDDDAAYCVMLGDFLKTLGHQSLVAKDVPAFRAMIEGLRPDLVVLDMQVPGGGGPAAAGIIPAGVPLIVSSGMPVPQQQQWFPPLTRIRFLQKPLDLDAMGQAVKELLAPAKPA